MVHNSNLALVLRALGRVVWGLGPHYDMPSWLGKLYNERQVERLVPIVSMSDWIWDKCGIVGPDGSLGTYDFSKRLCDDQDNPLYYFQTELLVDGFDAGQDVYYPAITSVEAADIVKGPQDSSFVRMQKWTPEVHVFWQRWVRQEMKANMDTSMIDDGLLKRSVSADAYRRDPFALKFIDAKIKWKRNIDGASTFAQNLIWFERRFREGRCLPCESFHIAYISIHDALTVRSVVFAVGVFVHDGLFYTTMGITKSFRVSMSDTHEAQTWMNESDSAESASSGKDPCISTEQWIARYNAIKHTAGSAVRIQQFVRDEIVRLGYNVHGLLFRPNGTMRAIMTDQFDHCLVGSTADVEHIRQLVAIGAKTANPEAVDNPPKIIQTADTINIVHVASTELPFWERRDRFMHPDSALNPHLPLVFLGLNNF